jgi:transketolase
MKEEVSTTRAQSYEDALVDLAAQDDRVVVLTAENRAAIRGIPDRLKGRFMDFGIAEATMVGAAAGLALRGRIPIVHALATFLTLRAFEFIRTDVGIPALPVKLIGAVPGFLSEANGPTHQAIDDIAVMRAIPSMRIFCPSDSGELLEGLPEILRDPSPWYVRFVSEAPRGEHRTPFRIGQSEGFGDGTEVLILTYGFLLREALEAQRILASDGIPASVLNLRTLRPLDEQAVLDGARRAKLVVTFEDHLRTGGLATILSELLVSHGLSCHVLAVALEGRYFTPALLDDVLRYEGFTGHHLARRIHNAL